MRIKIGDVGTFEKTISESDVYMYAGITGDLNPIHINKVAAEKTVFKERIVHGLLTGGLISTVIGLHMPGPGTVYLEQNFKFVKAVKIGDTVKATVEVIEILNEDKGILKLKTIVTNQNNELVVDGYAIVKVLV